MELTVIPRLDRSKGKTNAIRREGNIPGVIYAKEIAPESIFVNGQQFNTVLREINPGQLSTMVFTLNVNNKKRKAIIKDIQYQITSYRVAHLDFEEIDEHIPVIVKVPVRCVGVADCVGIKLGGFLRQVTRFIKVKCLPKDIPEKFEIDIKEMGIGEVKRLKDLTTSKQIKLFGNLQGTIIVISRTR